ncbi:helix-turn-helix domain-containing protein [Salinisphaera sp.]|uniref:helix-turn-helix domain-containing protein n=1 Tax=Salinisphaera sp. TaxID=1914330 RepID=UPI002D76ECA8|nr:cupin domain-containing protein [Salinisphaera sp.]HET7313299.1 cupin domain-containing protein [Salinisphaera sp.]
MPDASATTPSIGARLRTLRRAQGLSLDRTAQRTGISKAMLGQIERGESSPTIATLWKIATGLDMALSHFLADDQNERPRSSVHRQNAFDWHADRAGMKTRTLFPFDARLGFEMFAVEFEPGAVSTSSAHAAGTTEQIVVLDGELIVETGAARYVLRPGDTLQFAADRPHTYRNTGTRTVRAHDLIHYAS